LSGECETCSNKKRFGLQTKLKVNEPGDTYEREADRVADQVMATPVNSTVSGTPRIQRLSGQSNGQTDAAPASVDQALASPGRPLEPALRQDIEQRFGYDFSRVRVHSGTAAEQSARELNANAYTVGHNIVFGAGRFAPGTHEGRRLIAHELTHVVQQSGADGINMGESDDKRGLSHISQALQQGRSAPSPVGVSIGRMPNRLLQRDEKPATKEAKALEATIAEAEAASREIADEWKEIRALAKSDVLKMVIAKGDHVVELVGAHTQLAIDALRAGQSATELTTVLETDLAAYRFVAWYVVVGANLEGMASDVDDLIRSFDGDDREFEGREPVERFNRELQRLIRSFPKQVESALPRLKTHRIELSMSGGRKKILTVTNATTDRKELAYFLTEAEELEKTQEAIQIGVEATWIFLDKAKLEGLKQAVESYQEFRGAGRGKRGTPKLKGKGKPRGTKKKKKSKSKKCSDELVEQLNAEMHKSCNKDRSCSMQGDTCASATAKVAAGQDCVRKRTELQQKCFSPSDPGYPGHMVQIAQASAALRECLQVMSAKCR
jgi:hypothetical protein